MPSDLKIFFKKELLGSWVAVCLFLSVLISLIEGTSELSPALRIIQKMSVLTMNILPAALIGYYVLAKTQTMQNTVKRRVFVILLCMITAIISAAIILAVDGLIISLLPEFVSTNYVRYFATVSLIAFALSVIAIELELRSENKFHPRRDTQNNFLTFEQSGRIEKVKLTDISFISVERNYCLIHTNHDTIKVKIPLKKLLSQIEKLDFTQVHRKYLVPVKIIRSLVSLGGGEYHVVLNDAEDSALPVGRSFLKTLRNVIKTSEA